jgi:hypothetical protein
MGRNNQSDGGATGKHRSRISEWYGNCAFDSLLFEDTVGLKTPDWKESLNMTLEKNL